MKQMKLIKNEYERINCPRCRRRVALSAKTGDMEFHYSDGKSTPCRPRTEAQIKADLAVLLGGQLARWDAQLKADRLKLEARDS